MDSKVLIDAWHDECVKILGSRGEEFIEHLKKLILIKGQVETVRRVFDKGRDDAFETRMQWIAELILDLSSIYESDKKKKKGLTKS